jgi:hypothetical protein
LAACGADGAYPFDVRENYITLREGYHHSVYVFLLLLSNYGHDPGTLGNSGAKLFEEVCANAAEAYMGGPDSLVRAEAFGFPRRKLPAGFARAVDTLCAVLGEGLRHRARPTSRDQKDARLDVVAWRGFPDGKVGKLIAFGQCATGGNWSEKRTELQPHVWCEMWMEDMPPVIPVKFFFVPHRLATALWLETCLLAGVLFDRCRIAYLVRSLPTDLALRVTEWSSAVLEGVLRRKA